VARGHLPPEGRYLPKESGIRSLHDPGSLSIGMIRRSLNWNDWRWQMQQSCSHETDHSVEDRYPFRVTPYYLSLADMDDINDPIRRQFMPDPQELLEDTSAVGDPFSEHDHMPVPGLIHRFENRALLVASTSCAVLCRHCTRKNSINDMLPVSGPALDRVVEYLDENPGIRELLISGGDPLVLATDALEALLERLSHAKHIEVMRIGTRVPVVLPMRVNDSLVEVLSKYRPIWINTQFNHPRELTQEALAACEKLLVAGIPVSNQSVLLAGINDSVETMEALCNALQAAMIRPYYVFQCDPVTGIGHFRVDQSRAKEISESLRKRLGGLALPRFVADIPGSPCKVDIFFIFTFSSIVEIRSRTT
jgi:lysine 2,3-aminomutase